MLVHNAYLYYSKVRKQGGVSGTPCLSAFVLSESFSVKAFCSPSWTRCRCEPDPLTSSRSVSSCSAGSGSCGAAWPPVRPPDPPSLSADPWQASIACPCSRSASAGLSSPGEQHIESPKTSSSTSNLSKMLRISVPFALQAAWVCFAKPSAHLFVSPSCMCTLPMKTLQTLSGPVRLCCHRPSLLLQSLRVPTHPLQQARQAVREHPHLRQRDPTQRRCPPHMAESH